MSGFGGVVRVVTFDGGSRIEPPLDPAWSALDKLRWHATAAAAVTGLIIEVGETTDLAGHYTVCVGGSVCSLTFESAWTYISGVEVGVAQLRASAGAAASAMRASGHDDAGLLSGRCVAGDDGLSVVGNQPCALQVHPQPDVLGLQVRDAGGDGADKFLNTLEQERASIIRGVLDPAIDRLCRALSDAFQVSGEAPGDGELPLAHSDSSSVVPGAGYTRVDHTVGVAGDASRFDSSTGRVTGEAGAGSTTIITADQVEQHRIAFTPEAAAKIFGRSDAGGAEGRKRGATVASSWFELRPSVVEAEDVAGPGECVDDSAVGHHLKVTSISQAGSLTITHEWCACGAKGRMTVRGGGAGLLGGGGRLDRDRLDPDNRRTS